VVTADQVAAGPQVAIFCSTDDELTNLDRDLLASVLSIQNF
jgi:hypothetical protein